MKQILLLIIFGVNAIAASQGDKHDSLKGADNSTVYYVCYSRTSDGCPHQTEYPGEANSSRFEAQKSALDNCLYQSGCLCIYPNKCKSFSE